jgi:Lectin C-type domain
MTLRVAVLIGFASGCAFSGSPGSTPDAAPDAVVDGPEEDAMPDAPPMLKCPVGYEVVPNAPATSRYRKLTRPEPYAKQVSICQTEGTHLVVLDNAAEATAVAAFAVPPMMFFWIGASDATVETIWVTAKNAPAAYLPWGARQPDGGLLENCGLQNGAALFDSSCNRSYASVCECD